MEIVCGRCNLRWTLEPNNWILVKCPHCGEVYIFVECPYCNANYLVKLKDLEVS